MNLLRKFARDSLWLLIARIGTQGSLAIVTYLLARRLGTTGFGEYAFMAAMIVIGNVLTTFGSDMYLIREIASKSDFSEWPTVLILQLLLSILFIVGVYLLAPYLPNQTSESIEALEIYSLALMPLAFFTVFTSILRGVQRMLSYAWLNLVISILQVIVIAVFIQRGTSIVMLSYLLLGIQTIGTILAWVLCRSFLVNWNQLYISLDHLFSLFAACLPIALIAIFGILYQKISLAVLAFLGTASMAGLFSAAARVVEAARIGHIAVFTALYPVMANTEQDKMSRTTVKLSWFLLLLFSVLVSVLLFFFASYIVEIFFGIEYQPSISVLKVLSFTLVPYTVNSFLSLLFLAKKKERIVLRVQIVSLLILLILNFWFISRLGPIGAGWAIFIAESIQAVLFLLTWMSIPNQKMDSLPAKGVSYELSNFS